MRGPDQKSRFIPRSALGAAAMVAGLALTACAAPRDPGIHIPAVDCKSGERSKTDRVTLLVGRSIDISDRTLTTTKPGNLALVKGNESAERPTTLEVNVSGQPTAIFEATDRSSSYTVTAAPSTQTAATDLTVAQVCK